MASGGNQRPRASIFMSSDFLGDYLCEPCEAEGMFLEAQGFCENCEEFLCHECFMYHTKPSITRNHVLIDKNKTEEFKSATLRSNSSIKSKVSAMESSLELSSTQPEQKSFEESTRIARSTPNIGRKREPEAENESDRSELSGSRSDLSTTTRSKVKERCPEHEDEAIKYYCEKHEQLGCEACVTMRHRSCNNVSYIPSVSKDILKRKEYREFNTKVHLLAANAETTITRLEQAAELSRQSHAQAKLAREEFRKDIDTMINKLMTELDDQSTVLDEVEYDRIENITGACKVILEEAKAISCHLRDSKLQNNECGVYIAMKRSSRKLPSLETFLQTAANDEARVCGFQPNKHLVKVLREQNAFGKVEYRPSSKTDIEFVKDIRVRTSSDTEECWITGLAQMPNNRLVAIDNKNRKIKLVDTKKAKVVSWLRLSHALWDVTMISDTQVAATVPDEEKIVLVKVTNTVTVENDLKVSGRCHGVAFSEKVLFVSYTDSFPDKVELLDLDGKVLKCITVNGTGDWLFQGPKHVSSSMTGQTIYVSNWDNHRIISLSLDGSIKSVCENKRLKMPGKVAQNHKHQLLVPDSGSNKLLQIETGMTETQTLLENCQGLFQPTCSIYDQEADRLYIGMEKAVIKVLKFDVK